MNKREQEAWLESMGFERTYPDEDEWVRGEIAVYLTGIAKAERCGLLAFSDLSARDALTKLKAALLCEISFYRNGLEDIKEVLK